MSSSYPFGITAAGNTDNPCLIILRDAGYELWLEPNQQGNFWCASKDGIRFTAHSGPELLGIVTLWNEFGETWNRQTPDIYDELIDKMPDIED